MLVKDVMNDHPLVIGPEASVLDAKEIMKKTRRQNLRLLIKMEFLLAF